MLWRFEQPEYTTGLPGKAQEKRVHFRRGGGSNEEPPAGLDFSGSQVQCVLMGLLQVSYNEGSLGQDEGLCFRRELRRDPRCHQCSPCHAPLLPLLVILVGILPTLIIFEILVVDSFVLAQPMSFLFL